MKKMVLFLVVSMLSVGSVFAATITGGTSVYDANMLPSHVIGLDTTKTISATVTGTKVAFSDQTIIGGTNQLMITCVTPSTGALAAGRLKINNAGTEIPIYGNLGPFMVPKTMTSAAFTKYSTGTGTDSVKCTAYGN